MSIAEYIRKDLEARVVAGRPLPEPLTLRNLARHYDVSITPVRIATEELIRRNRFKRNASGQLIPAPHNEPHGQVDEPSEPEDWDQIAQQEAVRLSLAGREIFWREQAAADRYKIGRTRVRRIFSRMAGLGFLEHVPRRGWRVRPFDEKQMCDYLVVRQTLELQALDMSAGRLDHALLEKYLQTNVPSKAGRRGQLDNRLHLHWIKQSNNYYIQDFFDRHSAFYTTLFEMAAPGASRVDEMARQHRRILKALLTDDLPSAKQHLAEHIRDQQSVVGRLLEKVREETN
ncbi:MAG: GntR family transcriptional regulator [Phycisphaeraceae bacterium]|nr:GntR family transcriptional regulator [Phycisphaeraceae bacterium]